jgi:hypothetical protein
VPVLAPPVARGLVLSEIEIERVDADHLTGGNTDQAAGVIAP